MKDSPNIRKFLNLSTAHVTEDTAKVLDHLPGIPDHWSQWVVGTDNTYGWWIWAGQEDGLDDLPEDLRGCVDLAKQHDCDWILFDRDVEPIDQLPRYEW